MQKFQGSVKKSGISRGVHENLVEFPLVLVLGFDLWNFYQQGQRFHPVRGVRESQGIC